jgi:hypothetical protein
MSVATMAGASFMFMAGMAGEDIEATAAPVSACSGDAGEGDQRRDLGPEWRSIVAAAIAVGRELGVPERGWIVAVATGIQESRLTALDYGDRAGPDSRGWLQQRAGWGPLEVRMDPAGAARLFYEGGEAPGTPGLLDIAGWEQMPITVAAQKVQRSALPTAYAKWEGLATELVAEVAGTPAASCGALAAVMAAGYALPLPKGAIHLPLGEHHSGTPFVDIPANAGVPIFAMRGGTVNYTTPGNACGLGMIVTEGDGTAWTYCHASERLVPDGALVTTGQQVAKAGTTGHSTGNHLHLQILTGGANHCPQPFIAALMAAGPDDTVPAPASFPTAPPCV